MTTGSVRDDGSHGWRWRSNLTLVVLTILVLGWFLYQQYRATASVAGLPLDDSYIHLQFARNLAQGHGLAFLPERPVAGSTSPLWTALLAPGFVVSTGFAMVWAKVLGAGLFLFVALDVVGLARDLGVRRWLATVAGALLILTETLAFSALSGMEVLLFVALLVRGMRCWVREAASNEQGLVTPALWLFVTSVLARPEGLLVLGLALIARLLANARQPRWRARVRRLVPGIGLVLVMLLPTAALFYLWNGSVLPTTFAVKAGLGHRWIPSTRDVWRMAEVLFRVQPWMTFLAGAGAVALLRRGRSVLPVLWLLGLPLAYSALNSPGRPVLLGNFGRYAFPLLPFVIVLGCLGLDEAIIAAGRSHKRLRALLAERRAIRTVVLGLGLLLLLLPSILTTLRGAARSAWAVHNVDQSDVLAAKWIHNNLPHSRIGAQDIGALGFLTDNEIVDLVGLVNPEILPFLRGSESAPRLSGLSGLFEFAQRSGVEYLLLFPRSYGGLQQIRRVQPDLELVRSFKVDHNVAMAADELVLLRLRGTVRDRSKPEPPNPRPPG